LGNPKIDAVSLVLSTLSAKLRSKRDIYASIRCRIICPTFGSWAE